MRQFAALTRVNLVMALYQMSLLRRRTGRREGHGFIIGLACVVALLVGYMGWWMWLMGKSTAPLGLTWVMLPLGLLIITVLTLGLGLYSVDSVLFESADTDQLFAYPLPRLTVVAAKLSALVVENWLIGLVFWLPTVAVYAWYVHPGPIFYVFAVVALLLSTGVPLFILGLISYIVGLVTSGARLRKLLSILLTLALIAGLGLGIKAAVGRIQQTINLSGDPFALMQRYYPPVGYLVTALVHGSWAALGWGILWNALPFLLICVLIAASYDFIHSRVTAVHRPHSTRVSFGSGTARRALLGKEYKRLLSSPTYLLNSCAGLIVLILLSVTISTGHGRLTQIFDQNLANSGVTLAASLAVIFLILLSLANTTAPSISLEGKWLWIIQSLPVGAASVLRAKWLVHLTVIGLGALAAAVVMHFTFGLGGLDFVVVLVAGLAWVVASGLVGLAYNLHYHRFDFFNDRAAVKNSASVLATMGTMFAGVIVTSLAYVGLSRLLTVNLYVFELVWLVVVVVAIVALYRYLMTKGVVLFENLG